MGNAFILPTLPDGAVLEGEVLGDLPADYKPVPLVGQGATPAPQGGSDMPPLPAGATLPDLPAGASFEPNDPFANIPKPSQKPVNIKSKKALAEYQQKMLEEMTKKDQVGLPTQTPEQNAKEVKRLTSRAEQVTGLGAAVDRAERGLSPTGFLKDAMELPKFGLDTAAFFADVGTYGLKSAVKGVQAGVETLWENGLNNPPVAQLLDKFTNNYQKAMKDTHFGAIESPFAPSEITNIIGELLKSPSEAVNKATGDPEFANKIFALLALTPLKAKAKGVTVSDAVSKVYNLAKDTTVGAATNTAMGAIAAADKVGLTGKGNKLGNAKTTLEASKQKIYDARSEAALENIFNAEAAKLGKPRKSDVGTAARETTEFKNQDWVDELLQQSDEGRLGVKDGQGGIEHINLDEGGVVTALDATKVAKQNIWHEEIAPILDKAEAAGVKIDGNVIASYYAGRAKALGWRFPEAARRATELAEQWRGKQLSPHEAQQMIADFNANIDYSKLPSEQKAIAAMEIHESALLRHLTDEAVMTGLDNLGFQDLKNRYGALSQGEIKLADAIFQELKKQKSGTWNSFNTIAAGEGILGIAKMNPKLILASMGSEMVASLRNRAKSPDVAWQRMLRARRAYDAESRAREVYREPAPANQPQNQTTYDPSTGRQIPARQFVKDTAGEPTTEAPVERAVAPDQPATTLDPSTGRQMPAQGGTAPIERPPTPDPRAAGGIPATAGAFNPEVAGENLNFGDRVPQPPPIGGDLPIPRGLEAGEIPAPPPEGIRRTVQPDQPAPVPPPATTIDPSTGRQIPAQGSTEPVSRTAQPAPAEPAATTIDPSTGREIPAQGGTTPIDRGVQPEPSAISSTLQRAGKPAAAVAALYLASDEEGRDRLRKILGGGGGVAMAFVTPKAMKELHGAWDSAAEAMAKGATWDAVKGDFNASLVRQFSHGETATSGKTLKAPKVYEEVPGPYTRNSGGAKQYPKRATGAYEKTGEFTPSDYMDSLVADPKFMALSPFDRVRIFSEVERAYGTARTKSYKSEQSLAQNNKLAGSNIVAVDTIRGCTNNCPSCFANAGGGQGNIMHTALVPQVWKGKLNPKNVLRVGEVGDPAMDWGYSNGLVKGAIEGSKGASFEKNLFAITKLQDITGFDPKIWRNMEVSLDPLMPDHMAKSMENIRKVKELDPTVNIVVRVRSFKSTDPALMKSLQAAVDFAGENGLEILETKLRFKNQRYLAAIGLDPAAYKAQGAQLVYQGESVLKDLGNKKSDITVCGEGEIKGRCLSCRGCEKLTNRSVSKDWRGDVEYYRKQAREGNISPADLSAALEKLSKENRGGGTATAGKPSGSAAEHFSPEEIGKMREVGWKSREKLVDMPIDEFLKLAEHTTGDAEKAARVKGILDKGEKFKELPYLLTEHAGDTIKVTGHEGRHRAMALKAMGYDTIPVVLKDRSIRWGEQTDPSRFDYKEKWPGKIVGENGDTLPFRISREQAGLGYGAAAITAYMLADEDTRKGLLGGAGLAAGSIVNQRGNMRNLVSKIPEKVPMELQSTRVLHPEVAQGMQRKLKEQIAKRVPEGYPVRTTNVKELQEMVQTGKWHEGGSFEGTTGLSAQTKGAKIPVVNYGGNTHTPVAIYFPKSAVARAGVAPNEVKINTLADLNSARFLIPGYERPLTFSELKSLLRQ